MKKFSKKEKGFTLIEALIVVIIVAILAALGVARFLGVREATAQATCQSHLSTLNAAIKKWVLEHPTTPFDPNVDFEAVVSDAGNPECPSGGKYSAVGTSVIGEYEAKCNKHGSLSHPTTPGGSGS